MKIIEIYGKEGLATVYVAETNGKRIEFAESVQPPHPREHKWVMMVSSLAGCPVKCKMCDAGGDYNGALSREEIFEQIDTIIKYRYPSGLPNIKKLKIQFARVGEPSFNMEVLDVLEELHERYPAPHIIPAISTVAPIGRENFFERLLRIKKSLWQRDFQLQFSIHSTNPSIRDEIIPIKKWGLDEISRYGMRFYDEGGRKVTLNFILAHGFEIDAKLLRSIFPPSHFIIKLTPLNPTYAAARNNMQTALGYEELSGRKVPAIVRRLEEVGLEVILSIGELEENLIGSNCGQYIAKARGKEEGAFPSYLLTKYKKEVGHERCIA